MSGYAKLLRCVRALWGSRVTGMEETYRRYCIEHATDYVAKAELAWDASGLDGPHSMSGSQHLMEHLAHDMGLTERDEITFRLWWGKAVDHGFEQAVRKAAA